MFILGLTIFNNVTLNRMKIDFLVTVNVCQRHGSQLLSCRCFLQIGKKEYCAALRPHDVI